MNLIQHYVGITEYKDNRKLTASENPSSVLMIVFSSIFEINQLMVCSGHAWIEYYCLTDTRLSYGGAIFGLNIL